MSRKPVIALVGGIGSGKSAAAESLARYGGRVIAADPIGHDALRDPDIQAQVARRWPDVRAADGSIDRKKLGRAVFADPTERRELEAIVFPWIRRRTEELIADAQADSDCRFVVLDAAVVLEAGWREVYDKLVFIDVPHAIRVARVMGRGWSAEELDRREAAQWPLDRKRALADAVLDNSGSREDLDRHAARLMAQWGLSEQP